MINKDIQMPFLTKGANNSFMTFYRNRYFGQLVTYYVLRIGLSMSAAKYCNN